MHLTHLTLFQAAKLLARREISPLELTQACLDQIASRDIEINSFITLTAEQALAQARQAERDIGQGNYRGPLHGIPLALKDLYETAGVRTTAGSRFFSDYIPEADAFTVTRLRQAGAVLLGKLNMHEIALGVTNENPHYGVCHNPHDLQHISGGSSGGSAAALAAGFCFGSLGSDTGGSIRIPASLCGVVGFKPTYGRVSLRGLIPLSWNLDHAGPLARSVRDAALLLQAIAGYDPDDPYAIDAPVPDYLVDIEAGIGGWRVALADDEYFREVESEVWQAVDAAAQRFSELGAQVERVAMPEFRQLAQANGLMVTSDAAAYHGQRLAENPQNFGEDVLQRLKNGAACTSGEYILARRTQTLAHHRFMRFFASYDLLLTPATPCSAPPIQHSGAAERARQLTRFTGPFNLAGLPAISMPCGLVRAGACLLPVGLQIIGKAWDEARLLRAAWAFEQTGSQSSIF